MKVDCPSCGGRLDSDDMDLSTGLGKCRYCGELLNLREVFGDRTSNRVASAGPDRVSSNSEPQGRVERPFDARTTVTEEGGRFHFRTPPARATAATLGPMFFAIPWLAFVAFWTAGASGLLFGEGPPGLMGIFFPMFSIPFWIVGFAMLGGPVFAMTTSREVTIGPVDVECRTNMIVGPRLKRLGRDDVQAIREKARTGRSSNQAQPFDFGGLEIVYRGGTFVIPTKDSFEKRWLLGELWHALEETER